MCSFNTGNTEGTNSSEICVWCLCMYILFYVCAGISFVDWVEKEYKYEKGFEMCIICLWQSLVVLRCPCAVDWMLKFWLLTNSQAFCYLLQSQMMKVLQMWTQPRSGGKTDASLKRLQKPQWKSRWGFRMDANTEWVASFRERWTQHLQGVMCAWL